MPLDNKCRIGPLAGAPPDTCAVVISTETESGFITEDDTSPVCHTPSCPRSAKNPVDTAYDVGSVVSVLADVGSSSQLRSVVFLWFLLMALDVWKEVVGYTTSGAFGHTVKHGVAFAYLPPYLAVPTTKVHVELLGDLVEAEVLPSAPVEIEPIRTKKAKNS
ncbi:hypothetical protein TNCV_4271841 [Trichonephila clavipes]|nr:hypothetical protein TNCV_4271841 [Trichonephila clavipes]